MTRIPIQNENRAMTALSVFVSAMMVALSILVLAGAAALHHLDVEWRHALADRWTIEMESSDTLHPVDVEKALSILRTIPGVIDARLITQDELRRLLDPWLGVDALAAELPLPILIDLHVSPTDQITSSLFSERLSAVLPNAKLDDHESWTRIPVRIAQTGEVFGLSLFSAIILTALSTIAAAARARLAINRSEIELLHTLGASDGYIARQFQTDPFRSAAVGSLIGAAISATIIVIAGRVDLSIAPMIPQLYLTAKDVAFLLAVPIGATLLATLVARMTAYSLARRLP